MRITIEWPMYTLDDKGEDVETIYDVTCYLTKGEPQSWESPGCDPECDVEEIKLQGLGKQPGIDLAPVLWPLLGFNRKVMEEIQHKAFKEASDREEGALADWADNERKRRLEDKD